MKKSIWALIVLIIVIILIALLANRAPVVKTNGSLQVSAILSLTGPAAFYGEELKNGMELANAELASTTGANIGIAYEDSASTPAGGAAAMSKVLVGQNKDMVIVALSSVAGAISPKAIEAKIPVLQTIVSASNIAAKSPYTFRYFTSGEQEAPIDVDIAVRNLGAKKLAIIYSNDEYGLSYYNGFKARVESSGAKMVAAETYATADTDYRSQLTKISAAKPDVIYIVAMNKSLIAILKQIKEMKIPGALLTNWVLEPQSVRDQAGSLAEGVYLTTSAYDFENIPPATANFQEAYLKTYGKKPSAYAAIGYDVVNILSKVKKSPADTGLDIVQKIKSLNNLTGVMGGITIDANKEITFALYPARVENGKIVTFELK